MKITKDEFINCPIVGCNKKLKKLHWKHFEKEHGMKLSEVREKFPDCPEITQDQWEQDEKNRQIGRVEL
jgi:hypothetical protein